MSLIPAALACLLMCSVAVAATWMRPTATMADRLPPLILAQQVPTHFGDWSLDLSTVPIMPPPDVQAALDTMYSQWLARTYVNSRHERVMLSVAYSSDQGSEATQAHRPEFCYGAQGFAVSALGDTRIPIAGGALPVRRLLAVMTGRTEPITYWTTVGTEVALPGLDRKLRQMRFGMRGEIPDGVLVRVSSLAGSVEQALALQQDFILALHAAMPTEPGARFFGQPTASPVGLSACAAACR